MADFHSPGSYSNPQTHFADFESLALDLEVERRNRCTLLAELAASNQRMQQLELRIMGACRCPENCENLTNTDSCPGDGCPAPWKSCVNEEKTWTEFLGDFNLGEPKRVGAYSTTVRKAKIARYKAKRAKYLERKVLSRRFPGRSRSAKSKLRENGRFISLPINL